MVANSLSPRQERFCELYAKSASARSAAVEAGYAASTAANAADWIKFNPKKPALFRPCVAARVSELMQEQRERSRLTRERLQELRERIILGEEQDISVSVKGDVIEHPPDLAIRLKAMAYWEQTLDKQAERDRANQQASQAGITIDVPEEYGV